MVSFDRQRMFSALVAIVSGAILVVFVGCGNDSGPEPAAREPEKKEVAAPPPTTEKPVVDVSAYADVDAAAIVKAADHIRAPSSSFAADMEFIDYSGESQEPKTYKLKLYCKGTQKSVVRFEEPARENGKAVLMVDQDCWIYMPSTKKSIRISAQQRLVGQISNADAARLSFSDDYNSTCVGESTVNNVPCYEMELTAKNNQVAYAKLHYYVAKEGSAPQKIEYFALSGMLLKTGTYTKYAELSGAKRPCTLELVDAVRKGVKTEMIFHTMKVDDPPDFYFNKSMLDRIR